MALIFDDTKIAVGNAVFLSFANGKAKNMTGNIAGIFSTCLNIAYRKFGVNEVIIVEASNVFNGAIAFSWIDSFGNRYNAIDAGLIYDDGSGGGGGTNDYRALINKPQINGVTLTGDKSLADLGANNAQVALLANNYRL